jgi:hypothetical protein
MLKLVALALLLLVVGQATGAVGFALGDGCQSGSASCDASCPACMLCSCCAVHLATSQPVAKLQDPPDRVAFVRGDARALPASHGTSPLRHPPKSARA